MMGFYQKNVDAKVEGKKTDGGAVAYDDMTKLYWAGSVSLAKTATAGVVAVKATAYPAATREKTSLYLCGERKQRTGHIIK